MPASGTSVTGLISINHCEKLLQLMMTRLILAKEYQELSYDMQVTTTSIIFHRYAMLSMEDRNAINDRTVVSFTTLKKNRHT